MSPVLAPAHFPGPASVPPNFAIERPRSGRSQIARSLGQSAASGTGISIVATPLAAAVGDFVIVQFAWATGSNSLSTVTDVAGNTWTVVSTPGTNQSGGYGFTVVTTGWADLANNVTGTLASGAPGGRLWAAASIDALYSPVLDQHNETASTTDRVQITTSSPLAQAQEVIFIHDLVRGAGTAIPTWVWNSNFARLNSITGSGTLTAGLALGSYDNIDGLGPITGGFNDLTSSAGHGTSIIAVEITLPFSGNSWVVTPNDSVTMSDSPLVFDRGLGIADNPTLADALIFDRAINLADNPALADALAFDRAINLPGDSVTMSDNVAANRGAEVAINDSVTMSDSPLVFDRGLGIADNPALADSLSFDRAINLADNPALADSISFGRSINLTGDSVTMSDAASPSHGFNLAPADSVTMSDQLAFGRAIAIADNPTLADALAFGRALAFADAVTMSDAPSPVLTNPVVLAQGYRVLSRCYTGSKQAPSSEAVTEAHSSSIAFVVNGAEPVFQAPSFDGMFVAEVESGP